MFILDNLLYNLDMKNLLLVKIWLPLIYLVFAGYVILTEANCTSWNCDLLSDIVAVPWSVWIPEYLNYFLSDQDTYYSSDLLFRCFGVVINTGLLFFVGLTLSCLMVWLKNKLKA